MSEQNHQAGDSKIITPPVADVLRSLRIMVFLIGVGISLVTLFLSIKALPRHTQFLAMLAGFAGIAGGACGSYRMCLQLIRKDQYFLILDCSGFHWRKGTQSCLLAWKNIEKIELFKFGKFQCCGIRLVPGTHGNEKEQKQAARLRSKYGYDKLLFLHESLPTSRDEFMALTHEWWTRWNRG